MVILGIRFRYKVFFSSLLTLHLSLFLAGCAPATRVSMAPDFNPSPEQEVIYVLPFVNTLVPETFAETVFNGFVDTLNDSRARTGGKWFLIIKDEPKDVDSAWLAKHLYISGEVWGYIENSGCCATELRVKSKIFFHKPGQNEPSLEISVPMESFFEHDRSTLEDERDRLAKRLTRELADQLIKALATSS
ncbi:MAG: hypothetical protein FD174_801 [Geobacteraceae bacterium]|nr:MAG: hypothetical protein FD174_801 [Geobacteraceae bacterium]